MGKHNMITDTRENHLIVKHIKNHVKKKKKVSLEFS